MVRYLFGCRPGSKLRSILRTSLRRVLHEVAWFLLMLLVLLLLYLSGCGVDFPMHQQLDASLPDLEESVDLELDEMALFRLPVGHEHLMEGWIVGFDHDPVDHGGLGNTCVNRDGMLNFPYCYDQHNGTDFALAGGFDTMDIGVGVLAAADGKVVQVEDGNYDRCQLGFLGIDCSGHEMKPNQVVLKHDGDLYTYYLHLMKDSIVVAPGEWVNCGQLLGMVGSSGYSALPHLHFGLKLGAEAIDPYSGHWSQPWSYWTEQESWTSFPGELCQ